MVEPAAAGLGIDLTPLDRYEPSRAKVCASVRWLLHKVREPIPEELCDPLSTDHCGEQQLKPVLSHLLLSQPPYAQAVPGRQAGAPGDTASLLQLLNKKGISVRTEQGAVTETELSHAPLALKAHLALVDALMALAAQDTLEQVQMATEAEVGVGAPWENALLFWVNKVSCYL
ncbi:unnamed protein product [Knipowitschia caucasica]|uniref:CASAMP N-terminal domain-containing protein n=1 Tax=Knipowitschia caucasica TaxID=637954 RepID=A0AAV2LK52_KNICA